RYGPDELKGIFPWAKMVDFRRTGGPEPYNLAYALPAGGSVAPAPAVPHALSWGPADLLGYTLATPGVQAGGELEVLLYFRVNQAANTEQWFRLSLNDPAQPGQPVSLDQADP